MRPIVVMCLLLTASAYVFTTSPGSWLQPVAVLMHHCVVSDMFHSCHLRQTFAWHCQTCPRYSWTWPRHCEVCPRHCQACLRHCQAFPRLFQMFDVLHHCVFADKTKRILDIVKRCMHRQAFPFECFLCIASGTVAS